MTARFAVALAVLVLSVHEHASAAVLCRKRTGVVVERPQQCKHRETRLDITTQGPAGSPGPVGPAGADGGGLYIRDAAGRMIGMAVENIDFGPGWLAVAETGGTVVSLTVQPSGFVPEDAEYTTTDCTGPPALHVNPPGVPRPMPLVSHAVVNGGVAYVFGDGISTRRTLSRSEHHHTRSDCEDPEAEQRGVFTPPEVCCFENDVTAFFAVQVLAVDLHDFVPPFRLDGVP